VKESKKGYDDQKWIDEVEIIGEDAPLVQVAKEVKVNKGNFQSLTYIGVTR
jgi:major membrane immunogen (membrane-anchored lipoprotein)